MAVIIFFRKKKVVSMLPQKKPVPPVRTGHAGSYKAQEEKLCENGHEKNTTPSYRDSTYLSGAAFRNKSHGDDLYPDYAAGKLATMRLVRRPD